MSSESTRMSTRSSAKRQTQLAVCTNPCNRRRSTTPETRNKASTESHRDKCNNVKNAKGTLLSKRNSLEHRQSKVPKNHEEQSAEEISEQRESQLQPEVPEPNERSSFIQRTYLVRAWVTSRRIRAWHYVLIDEDKIEAFLLITQTDSVNVSDYGKVLLSGLGENPPREADAKVYAELFKIGLADELPLIKTRLNELRFCCTSIEMQYDV